MPAPVSTVFCSLLTISQSYNSNWWVWPLFTQMQRLLSLPQDVHRLKLPSPVTSAAMVLADINEDGVYEAVVGCTSGQLVVYGLGRAVRA